MTRETHRCPKPGCGRMIPNYHALCGPHWHALSHSEKRTIFRSLDEHGAGSIEHIKTIRRVAGVKQRTARGGV